MDEPIYQLDGDTVIAGPYARGPWDEHAQHGGATAAILMRAFEQLDDGGADLQLARATYELIRRAPLGELSLSAQVVRPGRRIQLLEATLRAPDGTEVVKARALRVARSPLSAGDRPKPPAPGPDTLEPELTFAAGRQMYVGGAIELRFARGHFFERGPAFAWLRLTRPLVAGEQPSPLQRVMGAADFPNGISAELSWDEHLFINPDLTVYLEREPRGEWIGLDARTRIVQGGIGLAQAEIYDLEGRIGRCVQSLYVSPRG
ncbi:MAG: thioesterase family protein [Solirubrobacteraceae bacterium]